MSVATFQLTNPLITAVVLFGMYIATMAPLRPDLIPTSYMSILGRFVEATITTLPRPALAGIAVMAWVAHIGEAVYAYQLCSLNSIRGRDRTAWTVQTFLVGIFSLMPLTELITERRKK